MTKIDFTKMMIDRFFGDGRTFDIVDWHDMESQLTAEQKSEGKRGDEILHVWVWEKVRMYPEKLGLEKTSRTEICTSSKYGVADIIQMMKDGLTVEEIEAKCYTEKKILEMKKKA